MSNRYCLGGAAAALALALGGFGAAGLSAQTGTVTGEVTAATTGAPIYQALVRVTETLVRGISNQRGRYVLQNVPVGVHTVRVTSVGFGVQEREITITPGASLVENFALEVSASEIDQLVVQAGRQVDRRTLGVSLPTLNVDEMKEIVPAQNFMHVMEGRVPGVKSIGSTGGVGSGRELRIRGTDSFGFTAQRPVIYIDGVRYDSQKEDWGYMRGVSCCYFSGGAGEDRLSDLNPEEIDRIEVLKGPAAATLFGCRGLGGSDPGLHEARPKRHARTVHAKHHSWAKSPARKPANEAASQFRDVRRRLGAGRACSGSQRIANRQWVG